MKIVLLDAATLGEGLNFEVLNRFGEVTVYANSAPGEVAGRLRDADVAIINKIRIGGAELREAKHLQLICVFATGYDNAKKRELEFSDVLVGVNMPREVMDRYKGFIVKHRQGLGGLKADVQTTDKPWAARNGKGIDVLKGKLGFLQCLC